MSAKKSPAMSAYVSLMRILGLLYLACALVFFFMPEKIIYILNFAPLIFNINEPLPPAVEKFWLVMSAAFMFTLSVLSFLTAKYRNSQGYILVHLLSLAASSSGYLYLYFKETKYFAYILVGSIDLLIFLLITFALMRLSLAKSEASDVRV